jgi:hypothetical protein
LCSSPRDPLQCPTVPAHESRCGLVGALDEVQDRLLWRRRTAGGLIATDHGNVHRKFTSTSGTKPAAQRSSAGQSAGSLIDRDPGSYRVTDPDWTPTLPTDQPGQFGLADLLTITMEAA